MRKTLSADPGIRSQAMGAVISPHCGLHSAISAPRRVKVAGSEVRCRGIFWARAQAQRHYDGAAATSDGAPALPMANCELYCGRV